MRKRVKLSAHDGSKNFLVFDNYHNGTYRFRLEPQFPYIRIIGTRDNIQAVDPPGGPMLSLGDSKIIPGFTLKRIECKTGEPVMLYFKSIKNASHRT